MGSPVVNGPDYRAGGKDIPFRFRVSRRASRLSLRLEPEQGLVLVIPYGMDPKTAESFLLSQHPWIEAHAHLYRGNRPTEAVTLFGKQTRLLVERNGAKGRRKFSTGDGIVHIVTGTDDKKSDVQLFRQFLNLIAKRQLVARAGYLAQQHSFAVQRIIIRNQKSRWGSCSSKGTISLNSRLCTHRPEVIDYVIFHELCHLRQMNHSPAFWAEVAKYVPNYKALRRELKSTAHA